MEGRIWGLSELKGCREDFTPAHEKILIAPDNLKDMVHEGDMVSWHGLWHRVCCVNYDRIHEEVVMTLAQ